MGGPRASTVRQIYRGTLCARCEVYLGERQDGRSGERVCTACTEKNLRTVVMNFMHRNGWHVSFLEPDCRTNLPRTFTFATDEKLFALVRATYQPEDALGKLEQQIASWARGSVHLRLTTAQYGRLKVPHR